LDYSAPLHALDGHSLFLKEKAAQLLDGLRQQLASASPHRVSVESKKHSLTHPADERPNQRWSGYGEGATIAVIEIIGNLGAVYLAFKAADLVFTYFVIRFIWRRRKWRPLSFRKG